MRSLELIDELGEIARPRLSRDLTEEEFKLFLQASTLIAGEPD